MIQTQPSTLPCVGRTRTCPSQSTPFSRSGPLGSLFENLSEGQMPNFLEMMAAISEISYEMTTDSDPCIECKRG